MKGVPLRFSSSNQGPPGGLKGTDPYPSQQEAITEKALIWKDM